MAILFAGTSIADFPMAYGGFVNSLRQSPYCLESVTLRNSVAASCAFTESDILGVSGYYYHYSTLASADFNVYLDGVLGQAVVCRYIGHAYCGIWLWNGTAYVQVANGPATTFAVGQTRHRFAVDMVVHATEGYVKMYLDGQEIASYSGNTTVGGALTSIRFRDPRNYDDAMLSGVIVADESALNMTMVQSAPTGAGAMSDWSGTFADVDEIGGVGGDFITASETGDTSTFVTTALSAIFNTAAYQVEAVLTSIYAGSVEPIAPVILTDGTVYEGAAKAHTPGFEADRAIFNLNPATGLPWAFNEASAAEVGVRLK